MYSVNLAVRILHGIVTFLLDRYLASAHRLLCLWIQGIQQPQVEELPYKENDGDKGGDLTHP